MSKRKIHRINTINEFHKLWGLSMPDHPLISVIDYSKLIHSDADNLKNWVLEFYSISLKKNLNAKVIYGQQQYDFDEGILSFLAPNQVFSIQIDKNTISQHSGWILLIHPDFLWNTALAKNIHHDFFDYSINEALFLSEKEEKIIENIYENIMLEYNRNIDKFSQQIIISQIETLLNFSERFYHRQFITRKKANHEILNRLEKLLENYFNGNDIKIKGMPTVHFISDKLDVSPNYLRGLLKSLTGLNAQQHIHEKLIEKAKERLSTTNLSVSQIAYELGFEHPQSFSKLFKKKSGVSPLEFRQSFN